MEKDGDGHWYEDEDWMGHGDWVGNDDGEMGYDGQEDDQEEQEVRGSDRWEDARGLREFEEEEEEEDVVPVVQRKRKLVKSGMLFL